MDTARKQRSLVVSIDLDDLRLYRAIHGLPAGRDPDVLYTSALPRFLEFCDRMGLRSTIFIVADDLRRKVARGALREAANRGHELASHSYSHPYSLCVADRAHIREEVRLSRMNIENHVGTSVLGFRSPGYNLSSKLLVELLEAGYEYDSSVLPSPPYFLARALAIAWIGLRGRRSASIVGRPRYFVKPSHPFLWKLPQGALMELPMTASGPLSIPLIGTTLAAWDWTRRYFTVWCSRKPFVQVEFHGIDFLDVETDGLDPCFLKEPALRVPLGLRIDRFATFLRNLIDLGFESARLVDLAKDGNRYDFGNRKLPSYRP